MGAVGVDAWIPVFEERSFKLRRVAELLPQVSPDYVVEPSYIVYQRGGVVYAKNGLTGEIEFTGTGFADVLNSTINALPPEGGTIFVKKGVYNVETGKTVTIRRSHVHLVSDGAVISHVGAPAYSATFYVPPTASVEDIRIEGFRIVNPELSENYGAGIYISAPPAGQVSKDIVIRDVTMEGDRTFLWIGAWGLYDKTDASVRIKRVWIENLKILHTGAFTSPARPVFINGAEDVFFTDSYIMGRDASTVPHDPGKPGGILVGCRKLYMRNVVVDGAHHNNFEGICDDSIIEGCVFRDSDDCIDIIGTQRLVVVGCMGFRSGSFVSPEPAVIGGVTYPSEDIVIVGNYIEDCNLVAGSGSRRIVVSGNTGRVVHLFGGYGGFEDVIVEGNTVTVTGTVYWNRGSQPDRLILFKGNRIKLTSSADYRVLLATAPANDLIQDIRWEDNETWGVNPSLDLVFQLGDYVEGSKYYKVRRFFMSGNVFRNCRQVVIRTVSDHSDYYVWHNCNMSHLEGGTRFIRFFFLDTGEGGDIAQDAIRIVASFDASIPGAQTKTVSNYQSLLPRRSADEYQALASIRSAPTGWAGYVTAQPNPNAPWSSVDVTLVTTSTATGTVYVEVRLSEAYPQGYGYHEAAFPRWRR